MENCGGEPEAHGITSRDGDRFLGRNSIGVAPHIQGGDGPDWRVILRLADGGSWAFGAVYEGSEHVFQLFSKS